MPTYEKRPVRCIQRPVLSGSRPQSGSPKKCWVESPRGFPCVPKLCDAVPTEADAGDGTPHGTSDYLRPQKRALGQELGFVLARLGGGKLLHPPLPSGSYAHFDAADVFRPSAASSK